LLIAGFWLLHRLDGPEPGAPWPVLALAVAAIGAPVLLAFAGWDAERWGYLIATNFLLVAWLWWRRAGRESETGLSQAQWILFAVVLLVFSRTEFRYFDGSEPRVLAWNQVRHFLQSFGDGSIFKIPSK
jgi:hypothetical protein